MATRTAISRARPVPRASRSPATLAQATISTSETMAEDDNRCGVSLGKQTPNRGGYAKRGEVVGRDQIREDHLRLISAALELTHWRQIERVCVDVRDADGPFANRGVLVVRERLNP